MENDQEAGVETQRTRLRRKPQRGSHDRETIEAILDEAIVCHLGLSVDGWPLVTPTLHVRIGEHVYLHGSAASRTLRAGDGCEVCLTATLIDGLVLARAAMHHSTNYRSVVLFGRADRVEDAEEKLAALRALVEKLIPGRWDEVRRPTGQELRATSVLCVPLSEASAKIRSGPPVDDEADYELPIWAGVLPLGRSWAEPVSDQRCEQAEIPLPSYLARRISRGSP